MFPSNVFLFHFWLKSMFKSKTCKACLNYLLALLPVLLVTLPSMHSKVTNNFRTNLNFNALHVYPIVLGSDPKSYFRHNQWDVILGTWGPYAYHELLNTLLSKWAVLSPGAGGGLLNSSFDFGPLFLFKWLDFSVVFIQRARLFIKPRFFLANTYMIWKIGHHNSLKSHMPY